MLVDDLVPYTEVIGLIDKKIIPVMRQIVVLSNKYKIKRWLKI